MLEKAESSVKEISEIYNYANEMVVLFETVSKKAQLSFVYQFKDSYNHFMDAVYAELSGNSDNVIVEELGSCRGHLVRLLYDCIELFSLKKLSKIEKSFHYPKSILNKAFPDYDSKISPAIEEYKNKIACFKLDKTSHTDIEDVRELYHFAKEIQAFSIEVLKNKRKVVWPIIGRVVAFLGTAVVSGVIGYIINLLLG